MGNNFIIAEGLEILEALKAEGQASVYKGRRSGVFFSAVKLLPKPLFLESTGDDYIKHIDHELSNLKKLSESPHPNVVKILNAGIYSAGSLPFIEMELIEGPDVENVLKPPGSIFSINEAMKVAEHLCNALEHCHRLEIIHGDIKTSNIKFNAQTGNYVLVDFGFAVMQMEQRRLSLNNSGAIKFIAPEQYDGHLLFQTDVYRFGVILFKLLAGNLPKVPFADLLSCREGKIPNSWTEEVKEREMLVPDWLVSLISKCLDKDPEKRFENGIELNAYFALKGNIPGSKYQALSKDGSDLQSENQKLHLEKEELRKALEKEQLNDKIMYRQLKELNEVLVNKEGELQQLKQKLNRPSLAVPVLYALLVAASLLGAFSAYIILSDKTNNAVQSKQISFPENSDTISQQNNGRPVAQPSIIVPVSKKQVKNDSINYQQRNTVTADFQSRSKKNGFPDSQASVTALYPNRQLPGAVAKNNNLGEYKIKSKAYFYDRPDKKTRRNAFMENLNDTTIEALDDQQGFIFIVFTNNAGQTLIGWLNKKDLIRIDQ